MKCALITGITGQDGSYLAELLLAKGYEVHGVIRRSSTFSTRRIDHLYQDPHRVGTRLFLHYGDMAGTEWLVNLLNQHRPDEVYHLAAQSHVKVSYEIPEYTGEVVGLGTLRVLDTLRHSGINARFYQASSSEMFGASPPPQNENTPFQPQSPYAAAKLYAYWITRMYREGYGMFACNGILFNHESPRRGQTFVTHKITHAIAQILAGQQDKVYLGNLDSKRDWGYAPEYAEVMWRMMQADQPDDYVIGTGEAHSVREFVEEAFGYVQLDWRKHIEIDPRYFRPLEVASLVADASRAQAVLGWKPQVTFSELVRIMVDADMESQGLNPPGEGKNILQVKLGHWHQWENGVTKALKAREGQAAH